MSFNPYLKNLNDELWFQKFVKDELKPGIPEVPRYNPREDNTEVWKYDSALREGYLMCMRKLGVKND